MNCTNVTRRLKQVRKLLQVLTRFTNVLIRLKNEEVDKGSKKLEDTKEAVATIHSKDSDKFEGQSKGSTG